MLELKLMDYRGVYTKSVNVNENDLVIISVISGDWVMLSPVEEDANVKHRLISIYDGTVRFLATKGNVEIINNLGNPYEIFEEFDENEELVIGEEYN